MVFESLLILQKFRKKLAQKSNKMASTIISQSLLFLPNGNITREKQFITTIFPSSANYIIEMNAQFHICSVSSSEQR